MLIIIGVIILIIVIYVIVMGIGSAVALSNVAKTGQERFDKLVFAVEQKLGHLDFFCKKCGNKKNKNEIVINNDYFVSGTENVQIEIICKKCKTSLEKLNLKRDEIGVL